MRPRRLTLAIGTAGLLLAVCLVGPFAHHEWADEKAADVIYANGAAVGMPTPDVSVGLVDLPNHAERVFGDRQLAAVAAVLPDVKYFAALGLRGSSVTDAGIGRLAGVPNLRRLDVGRTPVTVAGLLQLRGSADLREILFSHGQLSDADRRALAAALLRVKLIEWK